MTDIEDEVTLFHFCVVSRCGNDTATFIMTNYGRVTINGNERGGPLEKVTLSHDNYVLAGDIGDILFSSLDPKSSWDGVIEPFLRLVHALGRPASDFR